MSDLVRASQDSAGAGKAATLAAREAELARRESELAAFLADLRALRARYLEEVGMLYADLAPIEDAIKEEEVRLGMRLADIDAHDAASRGDEDPSCGSQAGAPDGLKQMFRNVARALHPDLAMHDDDEARARRQALMAEANRAYAARDAERLELILRAWEDSPESVAADHPYGERLRAERRIAQIDQRLVQIDAEFTELRESAIHRLKVSIDESARYGRDLLKTMRTTVEREIEKAQRRLIMLRRHQ